MLRKFSIEWVLGTVFSIVVLCTGFAFKTNERISILEVESLSTKEELKEFRKEYREDIKEVMQELKEIRKKQK
jgi:uncharacterized membrane protein (DUF106 family)